MKLISMVSITLPAILMCSSSPFLVPDFKAMDLYYISITNLYRFGELFHHPRLIIFSFLRDNINFIIEIPLTIFQHTFIAQCPDRLLSLLNL